MRNIHLLAVLAGLISACAAPSRTLATVQDRLPRAQAVAAEWRPYSRVVAMKLMEEYGPPDLIESERLIWYNEGPWDRIAVWDADDHFLTGTAGPDNLEQTVIYAVPAGKRKDLATFSGKLVVPEDGRQLSVRGNSEALNFLMVNLAHDIVRGSRDPADAQRFLGRAYQLSEAGKSSPYMAGLLFDRQLGAAAPR